MLIFQTCITHSTSFYFNGKLVGHSCAYAHEVACCALFSKYNVTVLNLNNIERNN